MNNRLTIGGLGSVLLVFAAAVPAQSQTGALKGVVVDSRGRLVATEVEVKGGPPYFAVLAKASAAGRFEFVLPPGDYLLSAGRADLPVSVPAFGSACVRVTLEGTAAERTIIPCGVGMDVRRLKPDLRWPRVSWMEGLLQTLDPAGVAEPFETPDAAALFSHRGYSWTSVRYTLEGMDVTDPYQPGLTSARMSADAVRDVTVRTGGGLAESRAYGADVATFAITPRGSWHGDADAAATGGFLGTENLPRPAERGLLRQPAHYRRFSHNRLQAGGPVSGRVDVFGSLAGEWSTMTVPLAAAGTDKRMRTISATGLVRTQVSERDQIQFHAWGSATRLPDWGMPAGIEALAGRRMSPSFTMPGLTGFQGLREEDKFRSFQAIWNRPLQTAGKSGLLQVRAGSNWSDLETRTTAPPGAQNLFDMLGGVLNGVAPLANDASRTRQSAAAAYQLETSRNSFRAGAEWNRAGIRNRFAAPSGLNLIAANGEPAAVVFLNRPADSRQSIQSFTAFFHDGISLFAGQLRLELGAVVDATRGGPVAWNSVSPRTGLALTPGWFRRLTVRGSYARLRAPLSGRALDFGDASSLGGQHYEWTDLNRDRQFQPGEDGQLLSVFGGEYSTIDPALKQPYADEFNVSAEAALPWRSFARASFFRRDEKQRLAAVNTGAPADVFDSLRLTDLGGDGVAGTEDDQTLAIYAQRAASLGADRYLLTNPTGLKNLNEGAVLELGHDGHRYAAYASFMAVKSFGPSNPGNSPIENDPGVIGALYADPNTLINATGRHSFDRAYVGKARFLAQLPKFLGGATWANTFGYMDGVVFGRRLLVSGLAQGPFLVNATVRGSPEGGHRAEYVLNWNMRLSRVFPIRLGSVTLAADILNVSNNQNRIQEVESSGPLFNQRLPLAIPMGRFARLSVRYAF